ncbi:MAG TPA: isoprenylcysteine carboxylmethyltransferase family protein [Nocardioides sp.]|uniref:methyltransferase family protein n=1 Tax=Nocardioides sp. TaxID=35761 RepID=UPI002F42C0CE
MLVPPPIVALAAGLAQRAVTRRPERPGLGGAVASAAIVAGSVALAATAARSFRRHGTTLSPEQPESASVLVATGPHAASRNPMYLGLTGLLLANAVRLRSWTAVAPLAAFVAYLDRVQIRAEEEALHDRFGAEYDDYRTRVPRWLDARSVEVLRTSLESRRRGDAGPEATPGAGSAGR